MKLGPPFWKMRGRSAKELVAGLWGRVVEETEKEKVDSER